jgi:hypothetical protein
MQTIAVANTISSTSTKTHCNTHCHLCYQWCSTNAGRIVDMVHSSTPQAVHA